MKHIIVIIALLVSLTNLQGQTWNQLLVPNTRNLYGCWFDPAQPDTGMAVGWFVQGGDRLPFGFFTNDGGATITAGSLFQIYFYASSDVWFTNSYNGVVVGNGIIQTTNGGSSWNLIVDAATTQAGILEDVMFTNTTDGYAVGQRYDFNYTYFEGMLYKTTNAGGSWTDFTISQEINSENTWIHAVYSTGNGVIYAGAENTLGGSTLFKSIDDGVTWNPTSFTQTIYSLYFTSGDTGFAASTNGLYKTTDAGLNWTNILLTSSVLRTVQIKNGFGFAAGENGSIYMTINNGATWVGVASPVTTTLTDITVISPNLAFAVGVAGTFLKFTNTVGISEIDYSNDVLCWIDGSNQLNIKWSEILHTPSSIQLINMEGSIVKNLDNTLVSSQFTIQSDISSLSEGVYLVKLIFGKDIVTKKIVIVKNNK